MLKYFVEIWNKFILLNITLFSTIFMCYSYKNVLLFLITQMHLNDEDLYFIFTDVTELFSVYLNLTFSVSVQVSLLYFVYYLFSFLIRALYFHELRSLQLICVSGIFFWIMSCLLASYYLIPLSWNFFSSFQFKDNFHFEARLIDYFNFYRDIYYLSAVYGQCFTLLFFIQVKFKDSLIYIKRYRKGYYYILLLIATLLTPPDIISQLLTTFLAIAIYEITFLSALFVRATS